MTYYFYDEIADTFFKKEGKTASEIYNSLMTEYGSVYLDCIYLASKEEYDEYMTPAEKHFKVEVEEDKATILEPILEINYEDILEFNLRNYKPHGCKSTIEDMITDYFANESVVMSKEDVKSLVEWYMTWIENHTDIVVEKLLFL